MNTFEKVEEVISTMVKTRSNTGFRGVSKRSDTKYKNPFEASFSYKGKREFLGYYKSAEEAQLARLQFLRALE